jgi:hypothetical protein
MTDLTTLERDPIWLRYIVWVRRLGYGFHCDTRGCDYDPPLSAEEIKDYDATVEAAFGRGDADPYAVALLVMESDRGPIRFTLKP